jgi:hypothetical protein
MQGLCPFFNKRNSLKMFPVRPTVVALRFLFINCYKDFFNVYGSVHCKYIPIYIQQDATSRQFIYIWKLLYMFRVVPLPIIRSSHNCIYSIWYLSHRYCYLPLSVGTGLSVLWLAYANHSTLKPVPTLPR